MKLSTFGLSLYRSEEGFKGLADDNQAFQSSSSMLKSLYEVESFRYLYSIG